VQRIVGAGAVVVEDKVVDVVRGIAFVEVEAAPGEAVRVARAAVPDGCGRTVSVVLVGLDQAAAVVHQSQNGVLRAEQVIVVRAPFRHLEMLVDAGTVEVVTLQRGKHGVIVFGDDVVAVVVVKPRDLPTLVFLDSATQRVVRVGGHDLCRRILHLDQVIVVIVDEGVVVFRLCEVAVVVVDEARSVDRGILIHGIVGIVGQVEPRAVVLVTGAVA